jgi:hypothetical protein
MVTFRAKYDGRCSICGGHLGQGMHIARFDDGKYGHPECWAAGSKPRQIQAPSASSVAAPAPMTNREIIERLGLEYQGFDLSREQVEAISKLDRLHQILVRCGAGRFIAPADQVLHFTDIIEREKSDHIRDLSLVADGTETIN